LVFLVLFFPLFLQIFGHFVNCPSPVGFTHCKALGEWYNQPKQTQRCVVTPTTYLINVKELIKMDVLTKCDGATASHQPIIGKCWCFGVKDEDLIVDIP
jgi:hypothetical protein